MKELVVISGKGGTGKTSLMAAFASLARNKVLCDADVDAADLHLITAPSIRKRTDFEAGHLPFIRTETCTACGLCRELCRWEAISEDFKVDPLECEGCGVCAYFCPAGAVDFLPRRCGEWYLSETRFGPMVHARLGLAEENSGKLVALVRQEAKKLAQERGHDLILTDGPPGIGCPVIAALGGASAVLIVTEPTVSGKHDMERVIQLAAHFKVPALVCVNKADLNEAKSAEIIAYANTNQAACLGEIPYDPVFSRAMVQGQTILEYDGQGSAGRAVRAVWEKIVSLLKSDPPADPA